MIRAQLIPKGQPYKQIFGREILAGCKQFDHPHDIVIKVNESNSTIYSKEG